MISLHSRKELIEELMNRLENGLKKSDLFCISETDNGPNHPSEVSKVIICVIIRKV